MASDLETPAPATPKPPKKRTTTKRKAKPKAPASGATEINLSIAPPTAPQVNAPSIGADAGPAQPSTSTSTSTTVPMGVDLEAPPEVPEVMVRGLLAGLGGAAHFTLGRDDVPEHWKLTTTELDQITPPLTRIINKRPQLRAAVARGDEATVAMLLAGYTGRNLATGAAAKRAEQKRALEDENKSRETDGAANGVATESTGSAGRGNANGDGRNSAIRVGADGGPVVQ